jgi:endoglucanase
MEFVKDPDLLKVDINMSKLMTIGLISILILLSCSDQSNQKSAGFIANPSGFEIYRGINISHWLSQTGPWAPRKTFFTKADVKLIDSLGFDHIRLPIDEEILWHEDGTINEESFQDVKNCLDWCAEYGLRVVIDLHILRSHHFNARNNEGKMTLWADTAAQNNFIRLWENLSQFLKEYSNDMVAYELMNEPVAPDNEQWNVLIHRAIEVIREKEPNRVIIFGSNRWQKPFTFPYLKIPQNDKNIILSFHTYHPYFVTHHKAFWSPARFYEGPVNYPGQCIPDSAWAKYVDTTNVPLMSRLKEENARGFYNKDTLLKIIKPAIDKAKAYGLQLYCNEFGSLPTISEDMRLRYYQDVTDNFRENDIVWANWDYKGNFGIVKWDSENEKTSEPNLKLVKILTE